MREVQACYRRHQQEVRQKVGTIVFTALAGHVCEAYKPDDYKEWEGQKWEDITYPMIPQDWKVAAKKDKSDLLKRIKGCLKTCDGIIVGTDSDVEGYGIYWMLEHYLHLEKYRTLRFVEHSLTEKEILQSLLSMTDYHEDPVHRAATDAYLVRSRADWLFGMNGTRVMSTKMGTLLRVGRVKAATLGIVYNNSMSIDNFRPEAYYQVHSGYGSFSAVLMDKDGKAATFKEKPEVDYPLEGAVKSRKSKREYMHAPKLFDLTTLQAEAGRLFRYTPARTLEIVQSLYEKHKVISYPRTQCCFVSPGKAKEFPMMLKLMDAFPDLGNVAAAVKPEAVQAAMRDKMVVNDAAVAKESHDALLPTSVRPDINRLTKDEYNICHLVYSRLLAQFLPQAATDRTDLVIAHGEGLFGLKGRILAEPGWRVLFPGGKDALVPDLKEGDAVTAKTIAPVAKQTQPPKRLDQASLVYAMKNIANVIEDPELKKSLSDSQGIGTPATRAGIIKELIDSSYMEDRKGKLYITGLGKFYVESLKGTGLTEPEFAARLDLEMKKVQYRETGYREGYAYVLGELKETCKKMQALEGKAWGGEGSGVPCPSCGTELAVKKYSYSCPSCGFKVQKEIAGKKVTPQVLATLCGKGTTPVYTFKKKDGGTFSARLTVRGKEVAFDFSSGIRCPLCKKADVRINRGGAFCDCGLKVWRNIAEHKMTDKELETLLRKGKLPGVTGLKRKSGEEFTADLVLKDGEVAFGSNGRQQ